MRTCYIFGCAKLSDMEALAYNIALLGCRLVMLATDPAVLTLVEGFRNGLQAKEEWLKQRQSRGEGLENYCGFLVQGPVYAHNPIPFVRTLGCMFGHQPGVPITVDEYLSMSGAFWTDGSCTDGEGSLIKGITLVSPCANSEEHLAKRLPVPEGVKIEYLGEPDLESFMSKAFQSVNTLILAEPIAKKNWLAFQILARSVDDAIPLGPTVTDSFLAAAKQLVGPDFVPPVIAEDSVPNLLAQ